MNVNLASPRFGNNYEDLRQAQGERNSVQNNASYRNSDRQASIRKAIHEAKNNVHPSTIIKTITFAFGVGAALMKFSPFVRRAAVKVGQGLSNVGVKTFGTVKNIVNKNSFDTTTKLEGLNAKFDNFFANFDKADEKGFVKPVTKLFVDMFGQEKGAKAVSALEKIGVNNKGHLFDLLAGTAVGALTLDPSSDTFEQGADTRDIIKHIVDVENSEVLGNEG